MKLYYDQIFDKVEKKKINLGIFRVFLSKQNLSTVEMILLFTRG